MLDEQIGLYIYPWATKSTQNFRFSGFTRFVTAGCLFGVRMRAITQDGDNLELINHRIRLRPGQQIHSIRYDETLGNPFEMVLMNEFKKSCLLIDAFAAPVIPKHLLYHLPAFDYILFGVQLFVRNQMTFEALNAFLHAILLKQSDYQIKIGGLCDEHQIHVDFISPFDNLFHGLDRSNPAEWICNQLGINPLQINTEARDDAEKAVVIICLKHLQTNSTNPILRDIWHDFVAIEPAKQQDIEDLFKIANAVMLAMTARETHDFEICSLLPLSEKQIQVEYDDYSRKYARCYPDRKSNYPAILNLTLFEPVITYSPTTNGLLFYFACALDTLSLLVSDKKLIHYAAKNIALFSKNISETHGDDTDSLTSQPPIDLDLVLGETMKPFGF